jgi:hypothetical protein
MSGNEEAMLHRQFLLTVSVVAVLPGGRDFGA